MESAFFKLIITSCPIRGKHDSSIIPISKRSSLRGRAMACATRLSRCRLHSSSALFGGLLFDSELVKDLCKETSPRLSPEDLFNVRPDNWPFSLNGMEHT